MRILIVEDEKRLAGTLQELLHRQGYTADVCYDGISGLDNARSDIYDLLVLDAMLPGLDAGADYYLTKPFEPEELLACIRSLLRRGGEDVSADPDTTVFGDLTLHMGTFLLECGGRSVRLSRREYDLMELLMKNGSQIVSKEQLILKVWGYDSAAEDNNVEVYISFLRRKLTHLQSAVRIKTLRMVGYCLEVAS